LVLIPGIVVVNGVRPLKLVNDWRILHVTELRDDWMRAQGHSPLSRIEPLG